MEHLATGGKPKNPIKLAKVDRAEQMHLLRETLEKIAKFKLTDDNFNEWESLWKKKAEIRARLSH